MSLTGTLVRCENFTLEESDNNNNAETYPASQKGGEHECRIDNTVHITFWRDYSFSFFFVPHRGLLSLFPRRRLRRRTRYHVFHVRFVRLWLSFPFSDSKRGSGVRPSTSPC